MTFVVTVIVGIGFIVIALLASVLSILSGGNEAVEPMDIVKRCRVRLLDASAGIALPSIEVRS
jgi:hypothetical protein